MSHWPPVLPSENVTTIDNLRVGRSVDGSGFDRFAVRTISLVADETINGHRFVSVASNGRLVLAGEEHPYAIGLILGSVSPGETVSVVISGKVQHEGWNFSAGAVYLDMDGKPVQIQDVSDPVFVSVGKVLSVDSFLIDIESPIFNS